MYKVFFNEKKVYLTDDFVPVFQAKKGLFYKFRSESELKDLVRFFYKLGKIDSLFVFHQDIEQLRIIFKKCFEYIEAAGGLVKNNNGEYLFIYRKGKWDLPKGKKSIEEEIKECSIREVEEECGISNLKIISQLLSTYHTYYQKDDFILKKTYWFEMIYEGNEEGIPQTSEDITELKWFKKKDIPEVIKNTYPSILDVLKYSSLMEL